MIIRVSKQANYSCISNVPIQDKTLSWQATGVMCYLLSKPDNWNVNVNHLWGEKTNGRDSVAKYIKELIDAGYIKKTTTYKRDPETKKIMGNITEYVIKENRDPENQVPDNPQPESWGRVISTDLISTYNTLETSKEASEPLKKSKKLKEPDDPKYIALRDRVRHAFSEGYKKLSNGDILQFDAKYNKTIQTLCNQYLHDPERLMSMIRAFYKLKDKNDKAYLFYAFDPIGFNTIKTRISCDCSESIKKDHRIPDRFTLKFQEAKDRKMTIVDLINMDHRVKEVFDNIPQQDIVTLEQEWRSYAVV